MFRKSYLPIHLVFLACLLMLAAFLAAGCASTGTKAADVSVKTYASLHQVLLTVKNVEWGVCQPVAATKYQQCTNPEAANIGLTDAKHQAINGHLTDAFQLEIKLGPALKAWRAGDPPPHSTAELLAVAKEIVTIVSPFLTDVGQNILKSATDLLDLAAKLAAAFSVPAPVAVEGR